MSRSASVVTRRRRIERAAKLAAVLAAGRRAGLGRRWRQSAAGLGGRVDKRRLATRAGRLDGWLSRQPKWAANRR